MVAICVVSIRIKEVKSDPFSVSSPVRKPRGHKRQRLNISAVWIRGVELPTIDRRVVTSECDPAVHAWEGGVGRKRSEEQQCTEQQ
jgi:hypothetical protein